jgi:hypothetical protein
MNRITTVRIAVARSESTPLIPTFAKTAVSAANNAESNAYIHHIISPPPGTDSVLFRRKYQFFWL